MSAADQPGPDGEKVAAAFADLAKSLRGFGSSMTVMGMMGAAWRGDLDRVRESLHRLAVPDRQRAHLAVLALLAVLQADEQGRA